MMETEALFLEEASGLVSAGLTRLLAIRPIVDDGHDPRVAQAVHVCVDDLPGDIEALVQFCQCGHLFPFSGLGSVDAAWRPAGVARLKYIGSGNKGEHATFGFRVKE